MTSGIASIAPEIVSCIAEGRSPSVRELVRVADQILADVQGSRSAFTCGNSHEIGAERLQSFRAAHAALVGTV